ncbi:hypothetical protein IWQ61_010626 [Dispira simplex]|nr:hypothetical protein IWQ61_010626 [Dispira simplex]
MPTLLQLGSGNQHQRVRFIPPVVAKDKWVCLSTLESGEQSFKLGSAGKINIDTDNPTLAQPIVVAPPFTDDNSTTMGDPTTRNTIDRMADIRKCLEHQEILAQAISTILQGLCPTML